MTHELSIGPGVSDDLILKFFLTFARFEYALKESGFTRTDLDYASPDWNRFINEVEGEDSIDRNATGHTDSTSQRQLVGSPMQDSEHDPALSGTHVPLGSSSMNACLAKLAATRA